MDRGKPWFSEISRALTTLTNVSCRQSLESLVHCRLVTKFTNVDKSTVAHVSCWELCLQRVVMAAAPS